MTRRTANTDAALPLEAQIANIKFGIEIEALGLSIREAANVLATCFRDADGNPARVEIVGGGYRKHVVRDERGREWTTLYDGSVSEGFEFVTPPITLADMDKLQEIVRAFRRAGAYGTNGTGMHMHVDATQGESGTGLNSLGAIKRFASIIFSREELFVKAFEASDRAHAAVGRSSWCRLMSQATIERLTRRGADASHDALGAAWYNDRGFRAAASYGPHRQHYHGESVACEDGSRYHGVNMHSFFNTGRTVELRYFPNPLKHAGKLRARVLFVLALAAKARNGRAAAARKIAVEHGNEKYALRSYMLKLGMSGDFFKVCRTHLLAPLAGTANRARPAASERSAA